jgi:uncharacterized protein (TIGR03083 family)
MSGASPKWVLTEKTGFRTGPDTIREALYAQRRRFSAFLMNLRPSSWSARSRCSEWTVHEVARHVLDVTELHADRLARRSGRFDDLDAFDPVTTPPKWLAGSFDQTPEDTCEALLSLSDEEHRLFASRIEENDDALTLGPLGRELHWSVLSLHIFWDAWMHERDIAFPLGLDIRSTDAELRLMVLYGLLSAAAPSAWAGDHLHVSLVLDGSPDHSYEISSTDDDIEVTAGATSPAALRGPAGPILDSMGGRGPALAELFGSSTDVVERLSRLRARVT